LDISFENWTSSLRIYRGFIISKPLRLGHAGEARQVKPMGNVGGLGWSVAALS
jgi:hypothetical protein